MTWQVQIAGQPIEVTQNTNKASPQRRYFSGLAQGNLGQEFVVPAGQIYLLDHVCVVLTAGSTFGPRNLVVDVIDENGNTIYATATMETNRSGQILLNLGPEEQNYDIDVLPLQDEESIIISHRYVPRVLQVGWKLLIIQAGNNYGDGMVSVAGYYYLVGTQ